MKLTEIAKLVKGELIGPDLEIKRVSPLDVAQPGDISFLANPKYQKDLDKTLASAIIVDKNFPISSDKISIIKVDNPYYALAILLEKICPPTPLKREISSSAKISPNAKIDKNVSIGDFVVVSSGVEIGKDVIIYPLVYLGENTKIGAHTIIYPQVTIRENTIIGEKVIIHSGTVIGGDGFGFTCHQEKQYKIPQKGNVIIGSEVEIGSNVSIDRATLGSTIIGEGTKIDNLVQIAHNVKIGKNCIIVAQSGIAGSSVIGDNVVIAGQSGITGHLHIGNRAIVAARSGVTKNVGEGEVVSGFPARPHEQTKKLYALLSRLINGKKK